MRCSYYTRRGQCTRPGTGNPPTCDDHAPDDDEDDDDDWEDDVSPLVIAVTDRLVAHPQAQRVLSSFGDLLDKLGGVTDGRIAAAAQGQSPLHPPRRARPAPPPPSSPPPPPPAPGFQMSPRAVMGFDAGVRLTKDLVKKKQRELAKFFHPDGKPPAVVKVLGEQMKLLNWAAAELLKECG